jgi:hypothetical protein
MPPVRRRVVAVLVGSSMLAGGAVGATVFTAASSSAAGTSTTATTPSGPPGPGYQRRGPRGQPGTFHSNESATHEKGESAQREAQETAGQFPTVP